MTALPDGFTSIPIAHRALHDVDAGRPENSLSAIRAAIDAGYGVELDLQMSRDGIAMVFHDYDLDRLTEETGALHQYTATELNNIRLNGSNDTIPTLEQALDLITGQIPVLLEIKDQDGALGPNIGQQERSIAQVLKTYIGPIAIMSFNPHSIAKMAELAPETARGLVTCNFPKEHWQLVPDATLKKLRDTPDYDRVKACFISHFAKDLENPRVAELKQQGATILSWTIRSQIEEIAAREMAEGITFEGYAAEIPA